jgi:hypothetical protein
VFGDLYSALEKRLAAKAAEEGTFFLPNLVPSGPVDFVFIAMEPSLGRWAKSADEAKHKVSQGFKNFLWSTEDFLLHFSIREFLCDQDQQYHLTDLSKGAMTTAAAHSARSDRYKGWYSLLQEELGLISLPTTRRFLIGQRVENFLTQQGFTEFTPLLHYSWQAAKYRDRRIDSEEGFERFINTFSRPRFNTIVEDVLDDSQMAEELAKPIRDRIKKTPLNRSLLQLVYGYKCAFEEAPLQ